MAALAQDLDIIKQALDEGPARRQQFGIGQEAGADLDHDAFGVGHASLPP